VTLALSQHVAGLGITLLATSLASYAYRVSFPKVDTRRPSAFAPMDWLPIPVLDAQTPLTLLALLLVPLMAWLLYRTPLGLAVRMVGENPAAAEGQGLCRSRLRIGAIVAGSALMGVAGLPHAVGLQRLLLQHGQRPRLGLRGAGGVRLLAAGQGAAGRAAVRLLRRAAAAPAAGRRRRCWGWSCPTRCT
jgi:ABC-type uncharacterized transport system permease subunit